MAKILVTGASGKLGTAVINHLLNCQGILPENIIAASRAPEKLAHFTAQSIEVRRADFGDLPSLESAFTGVDHLLIISTDAIGERLVQHKNAIDAAVKAGVSRLFYTSMPEAETSHVAFAPEHIGTETAIKASGLAYTIFRNNWYFENLFMSLPQALETGTWFHAAGDGKIAYIARDDIARAIANSLASAIANPGEADQTLNLAGETAYSHEDVAKALTHLTGKTLAVVNLSEDDMKSGLAEAQLPEPVIDLILSIDRATRHGDLSAISADAAKLAGRPLQTLAGFLETNSF